MNDNNELRLREQFSELLNAVLELGVTHRAVELDRDKWKKRALKAEGWQRTLEFEATRINDQAVDAEKPF